MYDRQEKMPLWEIYIYVYICDPARENMAYVHIKFDHFFGLWNFITLCLNIYIYIYIYMYVYI